MQDAHSFLFNLTLVLGVAAFTTVLFQRLRQPVVLGYLLAGAIVSPHTPFPVFADEHTIHLLAELGVILLMFSLGLEFSLATLFRVIPTAGVVAVIQCGLMMWLGYAAGQAFGWTKLESIYAGALIAISSTTIIVKAFEEQGVRGKLTQIVFGVLIVEDLIAILLLAVLTPISTGVELTIGSFAATGGRLAAFLAAVLAVGLLVVPRLIRFILRLGRSETAVVASVGICFGFALLAQASGYSVALGAFLAGALVAESGESGHIERLVQPVRDIFAAIFFVAVGMLIDPVLISEHWWAIVAFTAIVVAGKVIGVAIGVFVTGDDTRTAVRAAMSLAQIGEFSFIIAQLGQSTGATRPFLYPLAVSVSAATTLLTPWLIRASDPVATYVDARLPRGFQTFAALYGTWIARLRSRPREPSATSRGRRLIGLILIDAAVLAAIAAATVLWGPVAVDLVPVPGARDLWPWLVVVVAASLLALPFVIGIARTAAALAREMADSAFPTVAGAPDFADAPRGALRVMLEIVILLVIGIPLFAVLQAFVPGYLAPAVFLLLLLLLLVALWRRTANLQEHARAGAQAMVELFSRQMTAESAVGHGGHAHAAPSGGGGPAESDRDVAALHRLLPGLGEPVPIRVRPGDHAVGSTLAQLNLRGLTGATVLAIVRDRENVTVPTGREALRANDLLVVAGTAESIATARVLVERGSEAAEAAEDAGTEEAPSREREA